MPQVLSRGLCSTCERWTGILARGICQPCRDRQLERQRMVYRHGLWITVQDHSRDKEDRQERIAHYARSLKESGAIDWRGGVS